MKSKERDQALTLELLEAIEQRSDLTQRHLASRMGVALGLANSYLKRCVRKGLVKIHQAPANRYLYYLTPKGFTEKTRLTAEYLSVSLGFYRRASDSCGRMVRDCARRGVRKLGLFGRSELAEIAAMKAAQEGLKLVCVCDPASRGDRFLGLRVVRDVRDAPDVDVWLFTALDETADRYAALCRAVGDNRVASPDILGLGGNEPQGPPRAKAADGARSSPTGAQP